MLLPSALSCDGGVAQPKPQRPMRPKLLSFDRYDPQQQSQSPVVGLIASCRALQSMLGERFAPSPSPSLDATIRARSVQSPFGQPTQHLHCPPAPRGTNKRCRDEFEDEDIAPANECGHRDSNNDLFSTPKRQRRVPLELPPGLQASDFEALADTVPTAAPIPGPRRHVLDMPTQNHNENTPPSQPLDSAWTENDDRLLVNTVLSKLNLSPTEWNECAARLGKDKDSIGRRWHLLLGEGTVGLRRGSGRWERPNLDIKSW